MHDSRVMHTYTQRQLGDRMHYELMVLYKEYYKDTAKAASRNECAVYVRAEISSRYLDQNGTETNTL